MRISIRLWLVLWLVMLPHQVFGYDDRVALVIGNDSYSTEPLKNAVNDARAVAKTLNDLGFKVVVKTNADIATMRSAAVEFAKILDGATAAVFYYAGHGIQYRDKNYLVPIDAKLNSEPEIVYNALEVGQLLESMDDAKVRFKFIILDACRNNPFSNVFSSTGLAKISKVPPGTIISYAAAAGAVALDGEGENGLYTKHFLSEVRNPANQAGLMFQKIQTLVAQESANKQLPEVYSTPLPRGAFFFAERSSQTAAPVSNSVSGDTQASLEKEFWTSIKESKDIKDFQAYLEQFPSGVFAPLARNRINGLKQTLVQAPTMSNTSSTVTSTATVAGAAKPVVTDSAADTLPLPATVNVSESVKNTNPAKATTNPMPATTSSVGTAEIPTTTSPSAVSNSTTPTVSPQPQVQTSPTTSMPNQATAPITTESRSLGTKPAEIPPPLPDTGTNKLTASPPAAQVVLVPEAQKTPSPTPEVIKSMSGFIEFPDGARYNGEYKENADKVKILHGKGEYESKSFRYTGDFLNGRKQGIGTYIWSNGDRYSGDFVDDKPSGMGKWEFASGDKYSGSVIEGIIVGKGIFTAKNGDTFEGLFTDGRPNGRGVYLFASGDKYEGELLMGKLSGKGIYINRNGDRIDASFADGLPQGKGIYYFANGDRYEGDLAGGSLTGAGAYFYSNGLRSEGEYKNGVLNGKGAFYFNDGSWFEGIFEGGLKHAKGLSILKDGSKRPAEIIDGAVRFISN